MTWIISAKPMSVNQAWQGRRFKTKAYKAYEEEMLYKLPEINVPEGRLQLDIRVGFSNPRADLDNALKPFLDILQKKYGFDDKDIYKLNVLKQITDKGAEFIGFNICEA